MLREFTASDFPKLSKWVTSEELLFQFSATTFAHPLTYTDMEAYLDVNPERKFYIASHPAYGDYAFGEIIPQAGNVPRLGRLLIGNTEQRGKGLGKALIKLLLAECRAKHQSIGAELYVLTDNAPAIKCYLDMGFTFINEALELELAGKKHMLKKMRLEF